MHHTGLRVCWCTESGTVSLHDRPGVTLRRRKCMKSIEIDGESSVINGKVEIRQSRDGHVVRRPWRVVTRSLAGVRVWRQGSCVYMGEREKKIEICCCFARFECWDSASGRTYFFSIQYGRLIRLSSRRSGRRVHLAALRAGHEWICRNIRTLIRETHSISQQLI
jgi:hypothetical protein